MADFSNAEYADTHLAYGAAAGNAVQAAQLYTQRIPTTPAPGVPWQMDWPWWLHPVASAVLDFYVRSHMKHLVYKTPVDTEEDLVVQIVVASTEIAARPDILRGTQASLLRRCHACIAASGRHFEHLL